MTTRKKPAKGAGKKTSAPAPADARLQAIFEGSRDAIGVSRAKRQLLKVLHIITLYNRLYAQPELDITPRTFIFGAKSAPGFQLGS